MPSLHGSHVTAIYFVSGLLVFATAVFIAQCDIHRSAVPLESSLRGKCVQHAEELPFIFALLLLLRLSGRAQHGRRAAAPAQWSLLRAAARLSNGVNVAHWHVLQYVHSDSADETPTATLFWMFG